MTAGGLRPEVSVITIFHNEERFLPEAVASVEAQTGVRWELLLVDDGSTDASGAWARARAGQPGSEGQVRYLQHPGGANRGMSASRNLGLGHATGRWVTFLDADDVWLPGKLSAQLALLACYPSVEVLASPAQWWWSWAGPVDVRGRDDWTQVLGRGRGRTEVVAPPALVLGYLNDEWRSICDLVIARRAVERCGGYEPAFTAMFEDQVFHAKVLGRLPALVTAEWWYRYRQHPGACTAVAHQAGAHRAARLRFLRWLDHHLASDQAGGDQAGAGPPPLGEPAAGRRELRQAVRVELHRARHPRLTRLARAAAKATGLSRQVPRSVPS